MARLNIPFGAEFSAELHHTQINIQREFVAGTNPHKIRKRREHNRRSRKELPGHFLEMARLLQKLRAEQQFAVLWAAQLNASRAKRFKISVQRIGR
jgi:hypothetical protein